MMPESLQAPAAILLLGGGLMACFFGHRLFRIVLGIYGFVFGAALASSVMGAAEPVALMAAMVAGGLVGAAILLVAYFVGVALVGAALAALLVRVVWEQLGTDPRALVVVGASLFGAVMALVLQRYVIVVGTALGGAWSAIVGGLALVGDSALGARSGRLAEWMLSPMRSAQDGNWVIAAWFVVGLLGVAIQFGITAKK